MEILNIKNDYQEKYETIEATGYNTGGGLYLLNDEELLKIYHDVYFFMEEREENTDFLLNTAFIKHSSYPLQKVYINNEYRGYTMPYIKNAKTFSSLLEKDEYSYNEKIKATKDVSRALAELHKRGIVFGDIHSDNMIINSTGGYLIDLDDIRLPQNIMKFQVMYNIKKDKKHFITRENECTDNIKALHSFLSIILGINVEELAMSFGQKGLTQYFKSVTGELDFYKFIKEELNNFDKTPVYFHNIVDEILDEEKVEFIKRKINL